MHTWRDYWKTKEIEDAVYRETRMSGRSVRSSDGLRSSDLALSPEREPPLGAHIVTPRRGYSHHGIYVGQGRVVQYGGLSRGLRRGPVEEVSLSQFAQGRPICHRPGESIWFDPHEVVRRARVRLGENRYNVLTNNCEHFCEWCVRGEHRSYQVDDIIARYSRAWRGLAEAVGRSLSPRRGSADAH
jgi:Lecithin retinol acyltransferase